MIRFFAQHPTAANLLMIAFLVTGALTTPHILRETQPEFAPSEVEIRILYPGATAQEIEEVVGRRGEDAIDGYRNEIGKYMTECYSQVFDGLDDDNVIHHWFSTGRDVDFRNTGLIGGTWSGARHCEDQLWENRPCPGLERYRSPIEGLYHAHQTSGHPGALCLMAIPYNLMHILIEDGIAEPGKWWYPSPWYIPQEGKISADPDKKSKL